MDTTGVMLKNLNAELCTNGDTQEQGLIIWLKTTNEKTARLKAKKILKKIEHNLKLKK